MACAFAAVMAAFSHATLPLSSHSTSSCASAQTMWMGRKNVVKCPTCFPPFFKRISGCLCAWGSPAILALSPSGAMKSLRRVLITSLKATTVKQVLGTLRFTPSSAKHTAMRTPSIPRSLNTVPNLPCNSTARTKPSTWTIDPSFGSISLSSSSASSSSSSSPSSSSSSSLPSSSSPSSSSPSASPSATSSSCASSWPCSLGAVSSLLDAAFFCLSRLLGHRFL